MRFIRDLTHFLKTFPAKSEPGSPPGESPDVMSDVVFPIVDLFGTARIGEAVTLATSLPNVTQVLLPAVPSDKIHLVLQAHVLHQEAAVAHLMWLNVLSIPGLETGISEPISLIDNVPAPVTRSFLLGPGEQLTGRTSVSPGVGNNLTVQASFIELEIGEYLVVPS